MKRFQIQNPRQAIMAAIVAVGITGVTMVGILITDYMLNLPSTDQNETPSPSVAKIRRKRPPKPIIVGNGGKRVLFPEEKDALYSESRKPALNLATPIPVRLPDNLPSLLPDSPRQKTTTPSSTPTPTPPVDNSVHIPSVPEKPPKPRQPTLHPIKNQENPAPAPTIAISAIPIPSLLPLPIPSLAIEEMSTPKPSSTPSP